MIVATDLRNFRRKQSWQTKTPATNHQSQTKSQTTLDSTTFDFCSGASFVRRMVCLWPRCQVISKERSGTNGRGLRKNVCIEKRIRDDVRARRLALFLFSFRISVVRHRRLHLLKVPADTICACQEWVRQPLRSNCRHRAVARMNFYIITQRYDLVHE